MRKDKHWFWNYLGRILKQPSLKSLSKEIACIRKKNFRRYREEPNGNFRTNNLITEMKNSMSRLGSSVEGTEERNGELEDEIIEPIQSEP